MIHATSLSSKLFELDNFELLKQYLRKRNINGTGIDRILTDVQLKNDLSGNLTSLTWLTWPHFSSLWLLEKCGFNETRRKFENPSTRPRIGWRGRSRPSKYSPFTDGVFNFLDDNGNERNNTYACDKPKKDFLSN